MERKKFTLEDVKNYLEEFGFVWKDKLIYLANTRKYRKAKLTDFNHDVFLLLKRANQDILMLATINNTNFQLRSDKNKLDASDGWFEFLEEKKSRVIV